MFGQAWTGGRRQTLAKRLNRQTNRKDLIDIQHKVQLTEKALITRSLAPKSLFTNPR